MKTNDVIALGNALVELWVEADDEILTNFELQKGEMHLVDERKAEEILQTIQNWPIRKLLGGSSANTVRGISHLGGKTIFYGKVGNDEHGDFFSQGLSEHGVAHKMARHDKATGHALTLVTPDAERTFSVHLGAAVHLAPEDLSEEDIASSKILHVEAYQLEGTKDTVLHAIDLAKKHGTLVSMDLADPALIARNKELFLDLVKDKVDIVFVNEKEAKEFTGKDEEEALLELSKYVDVVVVKLGSRGSLVYGYGEIVMVDAVPVTAVDTTGAGDSYAAGFLHGFCQGKSFEECGRMGSELASKVVGVKGVLF
jgi:sugar/nucleoside kinase (ribokinase family)